MGARSKINILRFGNLLIKIWMKNPGVRFGQLIGNCFSACGDMDPYYCEDDEMEKRLRKTYKL